MGYTRNKYAPKKKTRNDRPDHQRGGARMQYEKNRQKIIMSQDICGICGQPVDKSLKAPHPLSPSVDHIIPVSQGGHPFDLDNLQLAHLVCNQKKNDGRNIPPGMLPRQVEETIIPNAGAGLPLSIEWDQYNGENFDELRANVVATEERGLVMTARGVLPALRPAKSHK